MEFRKHAQEYKNRNPKTGKPVKGNLEPEGIAWHWNENCELWPDLNTGYVSSKKKPSNGLFCKLCQKIEPI